MASQPTLRLGTRKSRLARWQANFVGQRLEQAGMQVEIVGMTTQGDRNLDTPLAEVGDKALFTKELDVALLEGRIDLAVHSLKDLPTELPEQVTIAAVSERAAPWDAFIAHPSFAGGLDDLPDGAQVATSSLRRRAQLLAWRSDLDIVPVRGNVPTRLEKLDASDWHGLVLAEAGLARLGRTERIRERIDPAVMLPAVSQGALGVVCRAQDEETAARLQDSVHHAASATATRCERAFLRRLEGGCQVPIGAHARLEDNMLVLDGCVATLDGRRLVRDRTTGDPGAPETVGIRLAESLLADGGREILAEVRRQQEATQG